MKIIIVGAGISGLTLYLYLRKLLPESSDLTVHIYEKHPSQPTTDSPSSDNTLKIGGFLAIAPNGLSVIRTLSAPLYDSIYSAGHAVTSYTFRSRHGSRLGQMRATDYSDPPLPTIVIARQTLCDCIKSFVPDHIITYAAVSGVTVPKDRTSKPTIHFADSTPDEQADIIIGADGVHSIVRKTFPTTPNSDHKARYVGLVGVGGLLLLNSPPSHSPPSPSPSTPPSPSPNLLDTNTMTLTFGPNGFFGYGAIPIPSSFTNPASTKSAPETTSIGWWSTYALPSPPTSSKGVNADEVATSLRQRHEHWSDPVVQRVIKSARPETVYPTWVVPQEGLSKWHISGRGDKGSDVDSEDGRVAEWGILLLGDAAHAMQPSAGQGVSMALEDVEVFAVLLSHYFTHLTSPSLQPILSSYEKLRRPRVEKVMKMAARNGDKKRDLGPLGERAMYGAIWAMGHLMWRDGWSEWLYCKDGVKPGDEARGFVRRWEGEGGEGGKR